MTRFVGIDRINKTIKPTTALLNALIKVNFISNPKKRCKVDKNVRNRQGNNKKDNSMLG